MDLNGLIYTRLSTCESLTGMLAEYDGTPAIFNTEFPADQQSGWGGNTQYPRLEYRYYAQVDTKRSSSGILSISMYGLDMAQLDEMEALVRGRLRDVLMKPDDEPPFCVAWSRSDIFTFEGNAVICKQAQFDILEYADQYTMDPDPVETINLFLKDKFGETVVVVGEDAITQYAEATPESPVLFARLVSDEVDHITFALTWMNCRIAIHVIAPEADARSSWLRRINTALTVAGEAIMPDGSPLRLLSCRASNTSDYLTAGQIDIMAQYILPRPVDDGPVMVPVINDDTFT